MGTPAMTKNSEKHLQQFHRGVWEDQREREIKRKRRRRVRETVTEGLNVSSSVAFWFLIMLSVILPLSLSLCVSFCSDSVIQLICVAKGTGLGLVIKGGANRAEGPMVLIQEIAPGGDCQKVSESVACTNISWLSYFCDANIISSFQKYKKSPKSFPSAAIYLLFY